MKKTIKKLFSILFLGVILLSTTACGKDENTITVAATAAPHAEILEFAENLVEEKGYKLDIKVFSDYILPNTATENGDVDANFFQHTPYLNSFNEENNTHLVSVGAVHYEPLGLYKGSKTSLDAIADGDKILVPNDTTNEARALLLLEEAGLIDVRDDAGLTATKADIVSNPKNLNIIEMNAELIAATRQDGAFAVINGNYALEAGLKANDAIQFESSTGLAATTYANILVVKAGNENNPAILVLIEVLQSEAVKNFITEKYQGSVIAA
jgi:D-methionine transport system substrate-binding protein